MTRSAGADAHGGGRTAQDACAVLVELGRALKGWSFYDAANPARAELLDRLLRVLRGETGRAGPLAVELRRGAFWLAGTEVAVGAGRLDDLARRADDRGVARLVFDAEVEAASLTRLLDLLLEAPGRVNAEGGFEAYFHAGRRRGISVNDADWRAELARLPIAESESALEQTLPSVPVSQQAGVDFASLSEPDPDDPADIDLLDELDPEPVRRAALRESAPPTLPALGPSPEPEREPEPEPVAPPAPIDEIGERLRELAECESDGRYREAARQLAFDAQSLVEQGRLDESHRIVLALAQQAGDDAKRSFAQRESARECLLQLARGAALGDLVRRACECDGDAGLAAISVLRELGVQAVPRLLDELDQQRSAERRERLAGILVAIGDEATPALAVAIQSGDARHRRLALQLAGEAQNPRLVPSLRDALLGGPDDVSREAAAALVKIGDVTALDALAEALESANGVIASCAAHALGGTGRVLAVAPLAAALDRALAAGQAAIARDFVRALGRLGRPEAGPVLVGLLERGGFFQRRKLREVKIAAVTALAHIPGSAADQALAKIARGSDAQLRQTALLASKRRARVAKDAPATPKDRPVG
ncbi:MAG: hypothetical protein DCC71_01855 [Proteobacteria bacterium]|nr:MAG: hypothetical protein DCC71_01855 [Pseudomonadota bacterium]